MLLTWILHAACGSDRSPGGSPALATATWHSTIELEENDAVINVLPTVSIDPIGGFLVSDAREAQIRRYSDTGELLWTFGRRGGGPGEFSHPRGVVRLGDGRVVAVDANGRFVIVDSTGTSHLKTFTVPLRRVENIVGADGSDVLVTARSNDPNDNHHIHVVEIDDGSVRNSFFDVGSLQLDPAIAESFGYVVIGLLGDTIAAAYAPVDSIFFLDRRGARLSALRLPSNSFRVVEGPPTRTQWMDPEQRAAWLASFHTISAVRWVGSDRLLVSYKTVVPGSMDWHWLLMSTDGTLLLEETSASRFLAADARTGEAMFVAPGAELPNRWARVAFR